MIDSKYPYNTVSENQGVLPWLMHRSHISPVQPDMPLIIKLFYLIPRTLRILYIMRLPTHDDNYPSSSRNVSKRTLAKSVLTTWLLQVLLKRHLVLSLPLLPQPSLLLFSRYPVPLSCDHMDCSPPGSFCPQDSLGKNTEVGCHFILQSIFSTHGSNLHLLPWQANSLPLSHLGSPLPSLYSFFLCFPHIPIYRVSPMS